MLVPIDERDVAVLVSLANRAPKTEGETYALRVIAERWNQQQARLAQKEKNASPEDRIAGQTPE